MGIPRGASMSLTKTSTSHLLRMYRLEVEMANKGLGNAARRRSYLDELYRRQRAACSYHLTTEMETRP
jgi:hypothetical protein